jgi:DNA-directed RNA polymerase subunit omega
MARVSIEDCLEKIDNRFDLVLLAAERTKQLYKGAHPLVECKENKEVVTVLREIAAGKVRKAAPPEEPAEEEAAETAPEQ